MEEEDREAYRPTKLQVLRPGGYVILEAFVLEGTQRGRRDSAPLFFLLVSLVHDLFIIHDACRRTASPLL